MSRPTIPDVAEYVAVPAFCGLLIGAAWGGGEALGVMGWVATVVLWLAFVRVSREREQADRLAANRLLALNVALGPDVEITDSNGLLAINVDPDFDPEVQR